MKSLSLLLKTRHLGEQGRVLQWWEQSPPTNVARVQIPALKPPVD